MRIPETGVYVYDDNATFEIKESEITEGFKVSKADDSVCIDRRKVSFLWWFVLR